MNNLILWLVIFAVILWAFAAFGAALVAFFKKENFRLQHAAIGFAAGVMIVVAFLKMLMPAMSAAHHHSPLPAVIPVIGGFVAGCLIVFLLDKLIVRIKNKGAAQQQSPRYKQSFMMMGVISVHKLPEGFAVGVLIGALQHYIPLMPAALALVPLVIAIGLHNLPEGTVVAVSFMKEGLSKPKSFFMGQVAGLVQVLALVAGFALVIGVEQITPYALAIGGGAMLWVAVHELIPEAFKIKAKHPYYATLGIIAGILFMLTYEVAIPHGHDHGHGHGHHHHSHHHYCEDCDYYDHDHHHD